MWRILAGLAACLPAACVPLRPYGEVRDSLPPDRLLPIDGRTVHVVSAGNGEPLVLLHGFGGSAWSWRRVTPELADRYRTIAIDLNGFGYSERPRTAEAYTVGGQLELVLGVMDALGVTAAHVAGHSYGGALASHLAWRHPDRVRSLILVDSAGPEYPWRRRHPGAAIRPLAYLFVRGLGIRRQAVRRGLERSFADDSRITAELVDGYFDRVRIEGVSHAYRGLTAPTPEPERLPRPEELDLPVLVVWGEQDELITAEFGRRISERLPRAELALLEGVGHIPPEESPTRLAGLMREFLGRHTGGG